MSLCPLTALHVFCRPPPSSTTHASSLLVGSSCSLDIFHGSMGDDEETVARGLEFTVVVGPDDRAELLPACAGVKGKQEVGFLRVDGVAEDGEQGLAAVVVQHELVGGGGAVPPPADNAAAEDVLGRQTDEDLFDNDPLKVVQDGRASGSRHGDWSPVLRTSDQIPINYKNRKGGGSVRMARMLRQIPWARTEARMLT